MCAAIMRYLFIRGLIDHEANQRTRHYLKSAAECTSRAIVSLELADNPICSVKQARQLEGIGGETCVRLTKIASERLFSSLGPAGGRFVSSAGAILVALLEATEESKQQGRYTDRDALVSENEVRRRSTSLAEESFEEYKGDTPGFCKAWWRLEILIKRGYVRRRSLKKSPVLQLLPLGRDIAKRLRGDDMSHAPNGAEILGNTSSGRLPTGIHGVHSEMVTLTARSPPGEITHRVSSVPDCSRQMKPCKQEGVVDALYSNDTGADGQFCDMLKHNGICYQTRRLKTGDYSWLWRWQGRELVLPCLMERKRADDIACTLKEGRFWSQVNKMVQWQAEFKQRGVECSLHYVLERTPEEYVVKCADMCQGVGRCGNPSLTQVKMAIADLKRHPQLLVKETDSLETTVILLKSLTAELADRSDRGDFDHLLQEALSDIPSEAEEGTEQSDVQMASDEGIQRCSTGKQRGSKLLMADTDMIHSGVDKKPDLCAIASPNNDIKVEKFCGVKQERECKEWDDNPLIKNSGLHMAVSNEEQLEMALQQSVHEMKCRHSSDTKGQSHGNVMATTGSSAVKDEEVDADLVKAINESKQMAYYRACVHEQTGVRKPPDNGDICGDLSHPLMQYHCSAGGTVNYPSSSLTEHKTKINVYRPKINRKRSETLTLQEVQFCSKVEEMGQTATDNWVGIHDERSANVCSWKNESKSSSSLKISNKIRHKSEGNNIFEKHTMSTSPCKDGLKSGTGRKTKTNLPPLHGDIDVDYTNTLGEVSSTTVKTQPSLPKLVITPSSCNIEKNVLSVNAAGDGVKKKCKKLDNLSFSRTKRKRKLSRSHETNLNTFTPETESAKSEKHVKGSNCKLMTYTNNDDYMSDEDIFSDPPVDENAELTNIHFSGRNMRKYSLYVAETERHKTSPLPKCNLSMASTHISGRPDLSERLPDSYCAYKTNSDSRCNGSSVSDRDSPDSLPDLDVHSDSRSCISHIGTAGENIPTTNIVNRLRDKESLYMEEKGSPSLYGSAVSRPGPTVSEELVKTVMLILPQVPRDRAIQALRLSNNDVQACISHLLDRLKHNRQLRQ